MDDKNIFSLKEMKEQNNLQVEGGEGNVNSSIIFDNLCGGLLTSLHLVQSSVEELLSLKDELLKQQALPPVVLSKIALCSTKVFRSVGDCWTPASELTRLVQLYSMPWEEKNKAYKKLYDNFESKKSQLNIAVRRLQLLESQAHRMEHENKVKKWENMFVKILSAKGHKRRWRFLTAWFKSKAREGPRALHKFIRHMARVVDSEGEEEEDDDEEEEKKDDYDRKLIQEILPHEPLNIEEREFNFEDMEKEEEEAFENMEEDQKGEGLVEDNVEARKGRTSTPKIDMIQRRSVSSRTRQVMIDRGSWTHEPEFDLYLCIRVFRPEELGQQDLTCHIQFDDQDITAEFLRSAVHSAGSSQPTKSVRGRGLVGSRNVDDDAENGSMNSMALEMQQSSYEDCVFCLPGENFPGLHSTNRQLNFEVSSARNNRLLATAIVDMDDLATMDLPMLVIPPPEGDNVSLNLSSTESEESTSTTSPLSPLKHATDRTIPRIELNDRLKSIKSTSFPLFAVGSDLTNHEVCGRLPLICIWAKQEKPRTFNRATESENLVEIVHDLTGFDLTLMTKEDLHKETADRATSPAETDSSQVFPETETIARSEYEKVVRGHVEELEMMRTEYETRLQEMAESLQEMEEAHSDMQRLIQTNTESSLASVSDMRSRSGPQRSILFSEKRSRSPSKLDLLNPQPPKDGRSPRQSSMLSGARLTRSATNVSSDVPQNFYDRLKHFKDKSQKHKQELAEKMRLEESESIEKRLVGNYKLSAENSDASSMQDVNLPAVFMPTKNRDLNMYNPRAHRYFHATGAHGLRLTQPPSILELPPISNSTIPVINLFEVSQNFQPTSDSGSWLIQRLNQQPNSNSTKTNISGDQVPLEMEPVVQQKGEMSQESSQREEAAVE